MQDSSRPANGYPYPNSYPSSATGYPPPNGGAAYPYYYAPPQSNPRAALYRRLFISFMACLCVIGLALVIFFLVVRPQYPSARLDSISVSGFNVSTSMVTGNWDLHFLIRNPNSKMSVTFEDPRCDVVYGGAFLSGTRLPPFDQRTKEQTPIRATFSVTTNYLDAGSVGSMERERAMSGNMEVDVNLVSVVDLRYGLYLRRRYVRVVCSNVVLALPVNSTSGKMNGSPQECHVF